MKYLDFATTAVFITLLVLACTPSSWFQGRLRFRLRRTRNWFMLGSMYACYYLCRHSLGVANKSICTEFGYTREEFGYILTAWLWAYAIGQCVNGFLADRIGGKRSMLLGAVGTIVFNIAFGAASYWGLLGLFVAVRLLDGYMQSMGAPGFVKINTAWFSRPERGGFSGIFGFMIQMGQVGIQRYIGPAILTGTLTLGVFSWTMSGPLHWRYLFWIPSIFTAVVAVVMAVIVRPTPESAGFQQVGEDENGKVYYEHAKGGFFAGQLGRGQCPRCGYSLHGLPADHLCPECGFDCSTALPEAEDPSPPPAMEMLRTILSHRGVWFCAIAYFCTGFVRYGLLNWYLRFLEDQGVGPRTSLYLDAALGMALAAVIGSLGAGYISDLFFKGLRAPVAAAMYLLMTVTILGATFYIHNMEKSINDGRITVKTKADDGAALKLAEVYDEKGLKLDGVPGIGMATIFIILVALTCNSTHSIIGTAAAMDIGGRKMAGFAAGVIDSFQYFAGGLTGFFVGGLIDQYGYTIWMLSMIPAGVVGSVCMLVYRLREQRHDAVQTV